MVNTESAFVLVVVAISSVGLALAVWLLVKKSVKSDVQQGPIMSKGDKTMSKTIKMIQHNVTLESVKGYFQSIKSLTRALKAPETRKKVEGALTSFARLDYQHSMSQVQFGEYCYKFLALPMDVQEMATKAMAEDLGLTAPTYAKEEGKRGRPTTGRKQLASVIYPEESLVIKEGQKDTVAGKRLSQAIRAYELSAGLRQMEGETTDEDANETDTATVKVSLRSLHQVFNALTDVMANEAEHQVILRLFKRLGNVNDKLIEKWETVEVEEGTENVA